MDRLEWGNAIVQCDETPPRCKLALLAVSPHLDAHGRIECAPIEAYREAELDVCVQQFYGSIEEAIALGWIDEGEKGSQLHASFPDDSR